MKMQKECSSETLVPVNQTKGHHRIPLIIEDVFLAYASSVIFESCWYLYRVGHCNCNNLYQIIITSLLYINKPKRGSILTPTGRCTVSCSIILPYTSLTQDNNKYFVS
jgi:hypothetical protein